MPSGSKKRKSSKKPKPQGDPPELDAGLEEAMANTGEEVREDTPSPVGIERDPEAMAERGFNGNKVDGEVLQEGAQEDSQTDVAAPDHDVVGQGNPPPLTDREPEIPGAIEAKAPSAFEPEGETVQQRTEPEMESLVKDDAIPEELKSQVDSDAGPVDPEPVADEAAPNRDVGGPGDPPPLAVPEPEIPAAIDAVAPAVIEPEGETVLQEPEPHTDTPVVDATPQVEFDAGPVDLEPAVDAAPDVSSDEVKADAETGLDEIESAKESTNVERGFELDAAPSGNESGIDESFVESAGIKPETDKAPDELDAAAAPAEVDSETGDPLVEVKPEVDGAPHMEEKRDEAPDEVPVEMEPETDGVLTQIQPEAQVEEPETATPGAIEAETEAAPTDVEAEGGETQVEEPETASPADVKPATEEALLEGELATDAPYIAEVEEAPLERELATVAASADDVPETDAAPVDIEAEVNTAQVETDALQDDASREIDSASPENETETDVAAREFKSDADAAVAELEPPTEVSSAEPETDAAPVDIEAKTSTAQVDAGALQDEAPQEIDAAIPENETETDVAAWEFKPEADAAVAELEPSTEVGSVEIEPEEGAEPTSIETIPQPEPQVEPLVEGEAEVNAEDVAAPEPEPAVKAWVEEPEVNAEDVENSAEIETRTASSQETELEPKPLDLAEDTSSEPLQDSEPELEAEAIYKARLEEEALIEAKPEERGPGETKFSQKDFAEEVEAASKVSPEPEVETANGIEMETKTEAPPEAEPESVVEAPAETEVDEKDLIHTEAGQRDLVEIETDQSGVEEQDVQLQAQESEPEIGDLEPSVAEDNRSSESQPEVAKTSEVPPVEDEGSPASASEAAIPIDEATISTRSSEISDNTDKEKTGSRPETDEGEEVVPLATTVEGNGDEVNVEELAKEGIIDQERAVDFSHGENEAVLAPAGNGGEAEVSSEQEPGSEQLPPADAVDVEESAKEVPLPSDQESATEQPQPLIDEQDPRMVQDAATEPPSVESEQSLNAYLTSDASAPLDEAILPASAEKFALEPEVNLESATAEPERDIGEEEAASSTVAEVGSVLNDFDERASCEQELPTDFSSTEHDGDISEGKELDDSLLIALPESVETGSKEQLESEPFSADANTVCQVEAPHEQPEVLLENTEAGKPAKDLESAPVEEMPSDEPVPSPQSEQAVQDGGKDEVLSSKEVVLANEEPRTSEENRAVFEDDKGAPFPNIAGDALISKASKFFGNGQHSETPSNELGEKSDALSVHQGEANNMDKAEIYVMDSKESKEAEPNAIGGEANHHADDAPVERALPVSEGRDINDFQAFRQESTQEASLPVVVSTQDRAVEQHANPKNAERSSGGGALKRRTKLLDCCGMFDLLLKKN